MTPEKTTLLKDRGIVCVKGATAQSFLQSLVTQDLNLLKEQQSLFTSLLTPQGRYLFDFFIVLTQEDTLLLDCARVQIPALLKVLKKYAFRQPISFEEYPHWQTYVTQSDALPNSDTLDSVSFPDPRLQALGTRILTSRSAPTSGSEQAYRKHRYTLGVAEGAELISEKSIILEYGFHLLNGLSTTKGCYLGQELMARTLHRGAVRKHIFPVTFQGDPPPSGTPVKQGDLKVGTLRCALEGTGLALLHKDSVLAADTEPLTAESITLKAHLPPWMENTR